jgi:predicted RNA-binding Zn-ribbon protein involved in translation (DUF1610 family)
MKAADLAMHHQSDRHSVRRVLLPSGRTIEVVYFAESSSPGSAATAERETAQLHLCPRCAADSVHPLRWEPAGARRWAMTLRCPNCEWSGGGVFDQQVVERLEDELDAGTAALVADLKRLTRANMEEELARFAAALAADAILPMDF